MALLRDSTSAWTRITRIPTANGLVTVRLITAKDLQQLRTTALSDESLGRHAILRLCSRNSNASADEQDTASAIFANSLTPAEIDVLANVVAALNAIRVAPGEPNAVEVLGQAIAQKIKQTGPGASVDDEAGKPPRSMREAGPSSPLAVQAKRLKRLTLRGGKH